MSTSLPHPRRVVIGAGAHIELIEQLRAVRGELEIRGSAYTDVTASDFEWGDKVIGRSSFTVHADRRQDATPAVRQSWHVALDSIAALYRATASLAQRARSAGGTMRPRADTIAELQTRIGALHQLLEPQVGAPSADMRAQLESFSKLYARLERAVAGK